MNTNRIDDILEKSGATSLATAPRVRASLTGLVADSRATRTVRRTRSRRALLFIPIFAVATLALTGGTLLVDSSLTPDIHIPLTYTTVLGVTYSCSIDIDGGTLFVADSTAAADYLRTQDWTGVGQRIYDRAVQLRGAEQTPDADGNYLIPPADSHLIVPTQALEGGSPLTWVGAVHELTIQTVPEELVPSSDYTSQWQSDCSGALL